MRSIVCATNMPFAEEAFGTLGHVRVLEGRRIRREDLLDAEILAVRSTTRVDRTLLEGTPVRFVGTATIGTDHLDIPWLEKAGIHWCYAAGCNANSVSEYITAALLVLARRYGWTLEQMTLGVVGVGRVGSCVVEKARALGLRVLLNDPPRQRETGDPVFVSLRQLQEEADIITFHVPLTKEGPDATWHMADESFFRKLVRPRVLINAARGPVVATEALKQAIRDGRVRHVVLDTWEGEPFVDLELMTEADLATPHIAGHSFEGKVMGTVMVYEQACRFFGVPTAWRHEPLMPPPSVPCLVIEAGGRRDEEILAEAVLAVYDIEADDRRFRSLAEESDPARRAALFDRQRNEYPMRREFPATVLEVRHASPRLLEKLAALGFRLKAEATILPKVIDAGGILPA